MNQEIFLLQRQFNRREILLKELLEIEFNYLERFSARSKQTKGENISEKSESPRKGGENNGKKYSCCTI